jgi:hypothetical protein
MKNRKKKLFHELHGKTNSSVACQQIILRISPSRIAFLRFIFEGYDGLAVVSTIDPKEGVVRIWFPPSAGHDVVKLLNELAGELK